MEKLLKKFRETASRPDDPTGSGASVISMKPYRDAKIVAKFKEKFSDPEIKKEIQNFRENNPNFKIEKIERNIDDEKFKDFLEGMKYQKKMIELDPLREDPQIIKKIGIGIGVGALGAGVVSKIKKDMKDKK